MPLCLASLRGARKIRLATRQSKGSKHAVVYEMLRIFRLPRCARNDLNLVPLWAKGGL